MDRLRVALIGPGFIAQRHLEVLSTEPGAELVGIASRSLPKAETAARRFGGRPYDDLERHAGHGAAGRGLGLRHARRPRCAGAGAHRAWDPPVRGEAARRRPRDAGAHQRRGRRRRGHRGRRLPLARDGHAHRAGGRDREPPGQAAQRPLARQPPGRRLVARPRDQRRPDGGAGDPPRGPLAPPPGRGDGRGRHRRPAPPPGLPRDGRSGRQHRDPPLRRGAGRDVHGDLHPGRDQRAGDPPLRRRPRDHGPPAGGPVRGRPDEGRHRNRRLHRQPPVGRDRDPLRAHRQRPVPRRGPRLPGRHPPRRRLAVVQLVRGRAPHAPPDVRDP